MQSQDCERDDSLTFTGEHSINPNTEIKVEDCQMYIKEENYAGFSYNEYDISNSQNLSDPSYPEDSFTSRFLSVYNQSVFPQPYQFKEFHIGKTSDGDQSTLTGSIASNPYSAFPAPFPTGYEFDMGLNFLGQQNSLINYTGIFFIKGTFQMCFMSGNFYTC